MQSTATVNNGVVGYCRAVYVDYFADFHVTIGDTVRAQIQSFSNMTRRIATKISSTALWSLMTVTIIVELMVTTTSNADEDPASVAVKDWGCAAAAAEYRSFGDVIGVPMTLIEGECLLQVLQNNRNHC